MNYLILLGAMIVYFYKTFYCGYVIDDVTMVNRFKGWSKELKEGKMTAWEYTKLCTYGAGAFKDPKQEYAFTLGIHYINCCLIYHMSGSLIGSLLYLSNPINNQTAIWLNGRRYALSILAVLLFWNWKILGIIAFPFCSWVSITGIAAPLLLSWTPYWYVIPIAGIIAFFVFKTRLIDVFKGRKSEFKEGNENQNLNWRKSILYVKSVGYNFVNCIFPSKPAMYHNFLFYFSNNEQDNEKGYALDVDFYKGVAVLAFLGYMMIAQHSFWAFWFLLFISPWCNIYQITMNASDRYCSLANVGAMLMMAGMINQIPSPYNTAIFVGFMVYYFCKYQPLFRAYMSVEKFYLYHLYIQPDLVNPRFYLARYYLENHDLYSAFSTIKTGLKYRPHDFRFLLCMMECLFQLGKIEPALKVMEVAQKNCPTLEIEDCKDFFDSLKERFKKEIDLINTQNKLRGKNVHNNGQPIMSKK